MTVIDDLINRIKSFEDGINEQIRLEIIEDEPYICDMNTEDQLYERGVDRNGTEISSYAPYAESTVWIKKQKGQPTTRVTLRDTGDFHRSFFVKAEEDSFSIEANDWKTEKLVRSYGPEIIGLTDENLNELIWEYIYPRLINSLREI